MTITVPVHFFSSSVAMLVIVVVYLAIIAHTLLCEEEAVSLLEGHSVPGTV